MPTLGQQVSYVTTLGDPRVAWVSWVGATTTVTLHVLLLEGDADWALGAVTVYANVPNDATGKPGTWH
jgi:hypothetical protein